MDAKEKKAEARGEMQFPKTCVYCGPSIRNVAKQYTVYAGNVPEALKRLAVQHPEIRGLCVPVERFAEVRMRLGMPKTAEAVLYEKLKEELA